MARAERILGWLAVAGLVGGLHAACDSTGETQVLSGTNGAGAAGQGGGASGGGGVNFVGSGGDGGGIEGCNPQNFNLQQGAAAEV